LKYFNLPNFLPLSIIFIIFFIIIGINIVYAQDDWHFVDESDIRLPNVTSYSLALDGGDVNSDESLDLLVGQMRDIFGHPGRAQLFLNDNTGYFSLADSSVFPQRRDNGSIVLLFDSEGDGDLDAFMANIEALTDYMAINGGAGIFHVDWDRLPQDTAYALVGDFADIEGNGDIDMCLLGNSMDVPSHRLWVNNGQGYFHDEINRLPVLHPYYRYIGFADLNGDLAPDIVAVYYDYASESHPIVFINDGTGHFTDESSSRLPQTEDYCWTACIMDIDGDGDFDILLSYRNGVGFLINDGTGHFIDETNERGPLAPAGAYAPVDADNDGDEDLIIGATSMYIFMNDGTGHFENQSDIRMPVFNSDTRKIFTGDLDGDGDADIFRVGAGESRNSIFINTLNSPDSIPPHLMNQTIFPSIDTLRGPYPVKLMAKDGISIPYQLSVHVHYSTDGITYQADSMHYTGAYIYYGAIPEVDSGETIYYYYTISDRMGNTSKMPANAPDSVFLFTYLSGYVGIEEAGNQLPGELIISAYPNAFNSDISIEFNTEQSEAISIDIFNILGNKVESLGKFDSNITHRSIIWNDTDYNGKSMPSGVYFCKLSYGRQTQIKKIMLLK
jgi:hypothetical protein